MKFVRRCRVRIGLSIAFSILATAATAETQACEADRTPIEMAGHTLCLLSEAMPNVQRDKNGEVRLLTWKPKDLAALGFLPDSVYYLFVEPGNVKIPSQEETIASYLPGVRESFSHPQGSAFHSSYYLDGVAINGRPFKLDCRHSLSAEDSENGGQTCEIETSPFGGLWITVRFATVSKWGKEPAWPPMDEKWQSTWPPYLLKLEESLNTLLTIK